MAVKNYGIHDKWTDLDKLNNVDIKSVDGVIESVKINGEEAGGGGSSDFSTAEVTIITPNEITVVVPFANEDDSWSDGTMAIGSDGATVTAILYKGKAAIWSPNSDVTSVSGNATLDDGVAYVTGDCTITIS